MSTSIAVDPHPLLEVACFSAELPRPLAEVESTSELIGALAADQDHLRDEETRGAVRRLLRRGGYRPAGRGKPASEYLVQAAERGTLSPINAVVDGCNAASLWGGLPISVVDLDRAQPPLRIGLAEDGASYVFNAAGQEITLTGLLCLHDSDGPCANAVKDAQRTKTQESTVHVLAVVWGTEELPGRAAQVAQKYREWLSAIGAGLHEVPQARV